MCLILLSTQPECEETSTSRSCQLCYKLFPPCEPYYFGSQTKCKSQIHQESALYCHIPPLKQIAILFLNFTYRSLLDRPSTDTRPTCRSTIDRESTDVFIELPLMSAEVSTVTISGAYRSITGGISVNYRRNVGRISFDSRARVYRYYVPIYRTILSTNISTYTRYYLPIYRPLLSTATIDRY